MTHLAVDSILLPGAWQKYIDQDKPVYKAITVERIGNLQDGMASGKPCTQLLLRFEDGSTGLAQVSWANLKMAVEYLAVVQEKIDAGKLHD